MARCDVAGRHWKRLKMARVSDRNSLSLKLDLTVTDFDKVSVSSSRDYYKLTTSSVPLNHEL